MTVHSHATEWDTHSREMTPARSILIALWLFPRNLAIALMLTYRKVISPLYGQVCRYYPSCSSYSLQSFQRFGLVRGVWLTIARLFRCNPYSQGGVDDVPERAETPYVLTDKGFVVPARRKGQK